MTAVGDDGERENASGAGAKEAPAPWSRFPDIYTRFKAPLLPSESDVASVRAAIAGSQTEVVLLGVTPALASLGDRLTAFDGSPEAVAKIWPGDSDGRRAVVADWRDLPLANGSVDAVIGDGSLNAIGDGLPDLLSEIARVLRPSGRAAIRAFCSPEEPETLEVLRRSVIDGELTNFGAYKWRVAMLLAARRSDWAVPVSAILDAVNVMFADRGALARLTGWTQDDFDTLDCYEGAAHHYVFPPLGRLLGMAKPLFSKTAVLANGPYPLSERCPTVVFSFE